MSIQSIPEHQLHHLSENTFCLMVQYINCTVCQTLYVIMHALFGVSIQLYDSLLSGHSGIE